MIGQNQMCIRNCSGVLFLVLLMAAAASSHTLHFGRTCPRVQPFPNLDLDRLLGDWYVVHKFDTDNTCLKWNVTKISTEEYAVTETRQLSVLDALRIDHKHAITATLDLPNLEVPAKLRVRWPTSITGKADFIIFDTDYETYMAVFECDRAGLLHRRSVTLLSRASVIDDMIVKRIRRLLDVADVPHGSLDTIEHNMCKEQGRYEWHMQGEFFGLRNNQPKQQQQSVGSGVVDYDISQIEILSDGISEASASASSTNIRNKNKPFV